MLRSTPLRLKLVTALVLPMLVVGGYLVADVADSLARREVAAAQRLEVDAFEAVSELSTAIGTEHLLLNVRGADTDQLADARQRTDAALRSLREGSLVGDQRLEVIEGHYDDLLGIRAVLGPDPAEVQQLVNTELAKGTGVTGPYSTAMAELGDLPLDVLAEFEFDPAAIDDVEASSLVDDDFLVQRVRADVRREASTLLRVAALPGELVDADLTEMVSSLMAQTDQSVEVLAQLSGIDLVGESGVADASASWAVYDGYREQIGAAPAGEPIEVDEAGLLDAAASVDRQLRTESSRIVEELESRASAAVFDANRDVVVSGLIGLWLLVCVGLVLRFLYRAIKRPLERLTEQAGHIARVELPSVIDRMRKGEIDSVPEVERIKVETNDEVGSLVGAFNEMHRSAVQLAAGQAASRRVVADMFVNLGRRNQRLVGRLLNGLSQLERNEQDPDQLAALYDLDHTATRMRRNAESLLVLAGASQVRRFDEPVTIDDVAHAAIGEVENYQRVSIDVRGDASLDGAAVSDVTHVLAELVENALTFSPPTSPVEVTAGMTTSGYVIAVTDNGIGMLPEQIDEVNGRIAGAACEDETPSDFLGHYVVGRLAARHGITVVLGEGPAGGVTARVWLPAAIVTSADVTEPGVAATSEPRTVPAPAAIAPRHDRSPVEGFGAPLAVQLPDPDVDADAGVDAGVGAGGAAAAADDWTARPVMPPPVDAATRPLGGTDPIAASMTEPDLRRLEPSTEATDFLAALERDGIQQRSVTFADVATPASAAFESSGSASAPSASVSSASVSSPADLPALPRLEPLGPPFSAAPYEPPAVEPAAVPAPAPAPATTPVQAAAAPTPAPIATPFGVAPRTPGANLPRTELLGSISGAMGSISSAAPQPNGTAAPGTPAPSGASSADEVNRTVVSAAADPDQVRSALSGFQAGITRADGEVS